MCCYCDFNQNYYTSEATTRGYSRSPHSAKGRQSPKGHGAIWAPPGTMVLPVRSSTRFPRATAAAPWPMCAAAAWLVDACPFRRILERRPQAYHRHVGVLTGPPARRRRKGCHCGAWPRRHEHGLVTSSPFSSQSLHTLFPSAELMEGTCRYRVWTQGTVVAGLGALHVVNPELLQTVGLFHLSVCLPVAIAAAQAKGHQVAPAVAKTLLVGGLAAAEVFFATDDNQVLPPAKPEPPPRTKAVPAGVCAAAVAGASPVLHGTACLLPPLPLSLPLSIYPSLPLRPLAQPGALHANVARREQPEPPNPKP